MKGAIFDMDGLLLDSEKLFQRAWRELAAEYGHALDDDFTAAICGSSEAQSMDVLRRYIPEAEPDALIKACKKRVSQMEISELTLKPGVHEILSGMRNNGFSIAVASSSPKDMIWHNLKRMKIAESFKVIVSGEDVVRGKPFPDIFLRAARQMGLSASECYVFEDSLNGITAAYEAGCVPIMIPDLVEPTAEIRTRCTVFSNLSEAWLAISQGNQSSLV